MSIFSIAFRWVVIIAFIIISLISKFPAQAHWGVNITLSGMAECQSDKFGTRVDNVSNITNSWEILKLCSF